MVDLTTLSKDGLIKEFEFVISKWQNCLGAMQPYKNQLSELENERNQFFIISSQKTGYKECHEKLEKLEKDFTKAHASYCRLFNVIVLLLLLVLAFTPLLKDLYTFLKYNGHESRWLITFIIIIFPIGTFFNYFFYYVSVYSVLYIIWRYFPVVIKKIIRKKLKFTEMYRQRDELYKAAQNNEKALIKEYENKKALLNNEIKKLNDDFQRFRSDRNNLAPKYYGYENILKGYLENGTADNFKEALLRLEEDLHRDKMLNAQEVMRSQVNTLRNQLSRQSKQLASQSKQLSSQSKQLASQASDIWHLSGEIDSLKK